MCIISTAHVMQTGRHSHTNVAALSCSAGCAHPSQLQSRWSCLRYLEPVLASCSTEWLVSPTVCQLLHFFAIRPSTALTTMPALVLLVQFLATAKLHMKTNCDTGILRMLGSSMRLAGYLTFNFWKLVFQTLGVVRQRVHVTGSSHQALPASTQGTHSSRETSAHHSTLGSPIKSPGFNPLYDGAPGESNHQATHDKLTTEPAKDPTRKDIGVPHPLNKCPWLAKSRLSFSVLAFV